MPHDVIIIPLIKNEEINKFIDHIQKLLFANSINFSVESRNETLNSKIRSAQNYEKIILTIKSFELSTSTVNVRFWNNTVFGTVSINDLIDVLKEFI